MNSLEAALKELIKEAVREVLREPEFNRRPAPAGNTPELKVGIHPSKKLLVKINEAAEMLSLSIPTLRRLISNGSLKVPRKTRHILIPVTELERLMKV